MRSVAARPAAVPHNMSAIARATGAGAPRVSLLIASGVELVEVSMLLGHSDLSTTQIYTHVARERMKEMHGTHHPRG